MGKASANNKKGDAKAAPSVIKPISENRKARFDYTILETFEAGLELRGSEVKSLRDGSFTLKDSYVIFKDGEAFLQNAHIGVYQASSYLNHVPERLRRLLLNKSELNKIERAIAERGFSCVPLKAYFKGSWAKLEIAIVKGKQMSDKRNTIKDRDAQRDLESARRKSR